MICDTNIQRSTKILVETFKINLDKSNDKSNLLSKFEHCSKTYLKLLHDYKMDSKIDFNHLNVFNI